MTGCQGLVNGGNGSECQWGHICIWDDENVLKLTVAMVAQVCEYTRNQQSALFVIRGVHIATGVLRHNTSELIGKRTDTFRH